MLLKRVSAVVGNFRRRPEAPISIAEWSTPAYGTNSAQYNTWSKTWYSSYYPYEAFEGVTTAGWCWSYDTDILTTSLDTTVWLDIIPGQVTVMDSIKLLMKKGCPTSIQLYGSDTGEFTSSDRELVIASGMSPSGIVGETYEYDWMQKAVPNKFYKFFRLYLMGPWQWFPDVTDYRFPQIMEMYFKVSEDTVNNLMLMSAGNTAGFTMTTSAGTASNAFGTSINAWVPNTAGAPNNDWLQVVFADGSKRYFNGWRCRAYNSSSGAYGRGFPKDYSLYYSMTGAFAGEEVAIVSHGTFNGYGMSAQDAHSVIHDMGTPIGPVKGLRWVFHDWDFGTTGYTTYGGITNLHIILSKALY